MREKEKEEEKEEDEHVDVVGLEGVMTWSQEDKDLVVFSAGQTAADELTVTTDGVILSSPLVHVAVQEVVMHIIDNVVDVLDKQINQCNSKEITSGETSR